MRQAINENRTVQIILVGVLMVVGGLFLVLTMQGGTSNSSGSGQSGASSASSSSPGSTPNPSTAAPSSPSAAGGSASASAGGAAPSGAVSVPANLVPGPGLPASLLADYARNKTIVLLVVRAGGVDDALVKGSVTKLGSDHSLSVHVARASSIARYAAITQGVEVDRVPALVILAPRADTNGVPAAQVSYGFRGPAGVQQAVRDAQYGAANPSPGPP